MKAFLALAVPSAIAGGVYFHGPLATGETYAKAPADAARILESMQLPSYVTSTINMLPGGSTTRDVVPGKSVTYYFHARGGQAGKFVATLAPVDEGHTRVSTWMEMSGDAETLMKGKFMPVGKEFATVGAAAMREQVDSRLEGRSFDKEVITEAMKGFAMANMGAIQQSASDAMDEAIKLQDKNNAPGGAVIVPGKPMLNPNAPRP